MITTLAVLAAVCLLSLAFILVIPHFASAKLLTSFLPRDIREATGLPVMTNEDLGFDSEAKEAVAFAVMASECIRQQCNNMPSVTGAKHPVVMGKISL